MNSSTPASAYAATVSVNCSGVPPIIGGNDWLTGASRLISTKA